MATSDTQKKTISFSIDSILSSTSSRETKQQSWVMSQSTPEIMTFPVVTCSGSAAIPIMPLMLPEYSDLRTDDQLSECSDASDKAVNSRASPSLSHNDSSLLSQENSVDYTPQSQSTQSKRKKSRTAFSSAQIDGLEKRYSEQHYLSVSERSDLAMELELSDQQVKTWFQNRRMKEKRQRRSAAGTISNQQVPVIHHLSPGGATTTNAPGVHHSNQRRQPMTTDFMVMPSNRVLPSGLPYTELYSYPSGYYTVPLTQLRPY